MPLIRPADHLIVAADFKPEPGHGRESVRSQVLQLADDLSGTGIYLKVNSALRACGYELIREINERGLRSFADLKLNDIPETLVTDGTLLRETSPNLLTVMCSSGVKAMKALKDALPRTEILGVTVLTSLSDEETRAIFSCSTEEAVSLLAELAREAGINGLISSPKEVAVLREKFGARFTLNTPAIRPLWAIIKGDDQNSDRVMTPYKAIKAGADRIVIGRPIILADNRYDAVMRTLDEIASALS